MSFYNKSVLYLICLTSFSFLTEPLLFINMALYSVVTLNLISATRHFRGIRRSFSVVRDWYLRRSLLGHFSNSHTFNQRLKYAWKFAIHNLGNNVNYFQDEKALNSLVFVAEDIDDEPSDRYTKKHLLTQENLHLQACLDSSAFISPQKSTEAKTPTPQRKTVRNVSDMKTTMFGKIPRSKVYYGFLKFSTIY